MTYTAAEREYLNICIREAVVKKALSLRMTSPITNTMISLVEKLKHQESRVSRAAGQQGSWAAAGWVASQSWIVAMHLVMDWIARIHTSIHIVVTSPT